MRWSRFSYSQKRCSFGLDISPTAIRLLALDKIDNHYQIALLGQQPLADHIFQDDVIQDMSAIQTVLETLLIDLNLWPKKSWVLQAVIAVPDVCTIQKTIQVSKHLSTRDVKELVHMELEKLIPQDQEEICFDYQCMGPSSREPDLQELCIVAARMQHVHSRMALLQTFGIQTLKVDIESFALQRVLPWILPAQTENNLILLLVIEKSILKAFFFKNQHLLFMREEETNRDQILLSIDRICVFFFSHHPHSKSITQILLSGDLVLQESLVSEIENFFHQSVSFARPSVAISGGQEWKDAHQYLIAFGLAKRG